MKTLTIQDIKKNGAKALPDDQPVMLIVNSKPKAVIMPAKEYEAMIEEMEDMEDLQAVRDTMDEDSIPAEEVYKALGLDDEI